MAGGGGRYRFLATGRWIGILAGALVVAAVCAGLGYWQLTRYQGKAEALALVEANYDADPVEITQVLPTAQSVLEESQTWTPVTVTGHYLTDAVYPSVVLPQRPIGGSPADHVIALFSIDTGDGGPWVIVVDRGWYPTDNFVDHSAQQQVPDGEVTLVIRLRPAEPWNNRVSPVGQVYGLAPEQVLYATLDVGGTAAVVDGTLLMGAYGVMASETPTTPEPPQPLPRPDADLGNHLSYTFQWWIFGIGALVGFVILARREADEHAVGLSAPASGGAPQPRPARANRRRSAEEDEDALIDSQLREEP